MASAVRQGAASLQKATVHKRFAKGLGKKFCEIQFCMQEKINLMKIF
jgi:hypothetical protein